MPYMHRVVVARSSKRRESSKNGDGFLWLSDGESEVLTGELRHNREARIEVVNVNLV